MQEYSINLREDGSAVIAKDKWNPDHSLRAMERRPFLFKVGQKVVDIFSNVVTIKEVIKHPTSSPGCCPEWNLLVEENGNCYRYTEIAGIYVRTISAKELQSIIKEDLKTKEHCKHCGECGYFMRYKPTIDGEMDNQGDCANLVMNKECNENTIDPFTPWAMDEGYEPLSVCDNENACGLFRIGRTARVRRIIKSRPNFYEQLRRTKT